MSIERCPKCNTLMIVSEGRPTPDFNCPGCGERYERKLNRVIRNYLLLIVGMWLFRLLAVAVIVVSGNLWLDDQMGWIGLGNGLAHALVLLIFAEALKAIRDSARNSWIMRQHQQAHLQNQQTNNDTDEQGVTRG